MKNIAIIGATGAVGQEILKLLEARNFPIAVLKCFASKSSIGKTLLFRSSTIAIETLDERSFDGIDLAFFAAGSAISKEWIPKIGCRVIDSSSAFRSCEPLIIPEINCEAFNSSHRILCSPNCAATILLMPLFQLHREFKARRIIVSTYQAASGGGTRLMEELKSQTTAFLEDRPFTSSLPVSYAFNLYPHNSLLDPSGYVEEELKIRQETQKILEDTSLQISATCIRVPVLRAHSLSANIEFERPCSLDRIYELWKKTPGLKVLEDRINNRFPTPADATGKDEIFCGRLREDTTRPNTIEFWAVGDQLLKGAALNAVQIAEALENKTSAKRSALFY